MGGTVFQWSSPGPTGATLGSGFSHAARPDNGAPCPCHRQGLAFSLFSWIRVPARWMETVVWSGWSGGQRGLELKSVAPGGISIKSVECGSDAGSYIQDTSNILWSLWFNGAQMMKQTAVLQAAHNTVAMARGRETREMRLVYLNEPRDSEPRDNDLILVDRRDPCFDTPATSKFLITSSCFCDTCFFPDSNK